MAQGPGKYYRKGITLAELFKMFPADDDSVSERWFIQRRWPNGVHCPHCGSTNVKSGAAHKTMPFRCNEKECGKRFSARTGTLMEGTKLSYHVWAIAIFLVTSNLKGLSSMKLHRDLGITQKSAWHLEHRIREAFRLDDDLPPMDGPVEVDEAFFGGKEGNKHASKKLRAGRGMVGKTPVIGVKSRHTKEVRAQVTGMVHEQLRGFVEKHAEGAKVYSDEYPAYASLPDVESVKHSVGEYVREQAHINGMESFWSMMKRGYVGIYHKMSAKHLHRYVGEYSGRHNIREYDTVDQMKMVARRLKGRRLRYSDLIADNGLPSGAMRVSRKN